LLPLNVSPDSGGDAVIPGHVQEVSGPDNNKPGAAADKNKPNSKPSLASSAAKLFLQGVKESSDAFPPLKSVAGGLYFIMDNCEVGPASWTSLDR